MKISSKDNGIEIIWTKPSLEITCVIFLLTISGMFPGLAKNKYDPEIILIYTASCMAMSIFLWFVMRPHIVVFIDDYRLTIKRVIFLPSKKIKTLSISYFCLKRLKSKYSYEYNDKINCLYDLSAHIDGSFYTLIDSICMNDQNEMDFADKALAALESKLSQAKVVTCQTSSSSARSTAPATALDPRP